MDTTVYVRRRFCIVYAHRGFDAGGLPINGKCTVRLSTVSAPLLLGYRSSLTQSQSSIETRDATIDDDAESLDLYPQPEAGEPVHVHGSQTHHLEYKREDLGCD